MTLLQRLLNQFRPSSRGGRPRSAHRHAERSGARRTFEQLEDRICMSISPGPADPADPTDGVAAVATVESALGAQSFAAPTEQNFRWAASTNTIYVSGDVAATLSDIKFYLPNAPLVLVDAAQQVWYLGATLRLSEGAKLELHGSAAGGDVDELRLRSVNTNEAFAYVEIRADWGTIDIESTKIFSWDDAAGGPDTEYDTYGRAFIRARSTLDGTTPRESRMDIYDSEIGYLGFHGAESYGLSWKANVASIELLDVVNVYGDIRDSFIHHNYFGVYTYGHYGGLWIGNEVAHSVAYGIDPHDDSDYLVIENNYVHHNGAHGIIASQRCDHLTIRNNTSMYNVGNGIMLHRESDDSVIEGNTVIHNGDSGIAVFDSHRNVIENNISRFNLHGIRFSVAASDNTIEGNDLSYNTGRGVNFFSGSDVPNSGGDSRPKRNRFVNNLIQSNGSEGIRLRDGDYNTFEANTIADNGSPSVFWDSVGSEMINNLFEDSRIRLVGSDEFATSLVLDRQVPREIQLDAFSRAVIAEQSGQIYNVSGSNLATAITPAGVSILLDFATAGQLVTVEKLPLYVSIVDQSATVRPILWSTAGNGQRKFEVQAASSTQLFYFAFAELVPLSKYEITRDGAKLAELQADHQGRIRFMDQSGTTEPVVYELVADIEVAVPNAGLIQAEDFVRRVDGRPAGGNTVDDFRWFVVDGETPGGAYLGATGDSADYLQALRASDGANVSGKDLLQPGLVYVEYDVQIEQAGNYKLDVHVAGLSTGSDSLWVEITTANPGGGPAALNRSTNSTGIFEWRAAGEWSLAEGVHTIRLTMRESGTAVDALELTRIDGEVPPPPPEEPAPPALPIVESELMLQAEEFQRRAEGSPDGGSVSELFRWFNVPTETAAGGQFVGATPTGTAGYIRALRASDATLVPGKNLAAPGMTYVEFDFVVPATGLFRLDIRAAGLGASSDSVWVDIASGVTSAGGPVSRSTNATGVFEWQTVSNWLLGEGTHTIRLSMRESGAAVDALRLTRL